PMLAAHGMRGTFYVNSGTVGSTGHLSWGDLSQLASSGNEIGGHTLDHVDLRTLDSTGARYEICEDRGRLLNHGFAVTDFAYPYGVGLKYESIVQQCGYNSGRRAWGLVGSGCPTCTAYASPIPPTDPYWIPTTDAVTNTTTLAEMQSWVTGAETHGGGWVI